MNVLDTTYKRKSAIITAVILLLLLLAIFNLGMKYLDPPVEYGLAINFGNSEVGSGEPVAETQKLTVPEEVEEQPTEEVEELVEETPTETIQEDVVTDETAEEVPVIEKKEETPKEVVKEEPKKEESKPVEKPKPKPSKATTDALNSLLNGNSNNGETSGEGDDKEVGVKGNENGDPNSNKYYGNSDTGSGDNYNLGKRKAISTPIEKPDCEEEGTVVVFIEVDKNGKVIKADPGKKGSTNTANCLLVAAKKAALQTKWSADDGAPIRQKGSIRYNFSLSK